MIPHPFPRRDFSLRIASIISGLGIAGNLLAQSAQADNQELSHTAESIHQEVVINASPKRIYAALTDARQFTKVTAFSPVMKAAPAEISRQVGGSFSLFGGHIIGRHIELVPNQRIVQAWRVVTWDPGIYSIARFELKEQGSQSELILDHTGFPNGKGDHLASGWKTNYWEPLQKYLA